MVLVSGWKPTLQRQRYGVGLEKNEVRAGRGSEREVEAKDGAVCEKGDLCLPGPLFVSPHPLLPRRPPTLELLCKQIYTVVFILCKW